MYGTGGKAYVQVLLYKYRVSLQHSLLLIVKRRRSIKRPTVGYTCPHLNIFLNEGDTNSVIISQEEHAGPSQSVYSTARNGDVRCPGENAYKYFIVTFGRIFCVESERQVSNR